VSPTNPDDSRLMALADSIDEGEEVDWEAAEQGAADEDERAAIRELRLVAEIASVCRDPDAARETVVPEQAGGPGDPGPGTAGLGHSAAGAAGATPALPQRPSAQPPARWGPYQLSDLLGRGAYGRVYRAVDNLQREVALKLLAETDEGAPADSARVLREGRLLARIRHSNVVKVHAVDEFDGRVGLSMELIEGFTLEQELEARGAFGAGEATLIGLELCRALAAVHAAGLLHRDIKAQNVMREWGGRIILMDLGAGHDAARMPLRPTMVLAGTPLYLAPELFAGRTASSASDIYSLGVLVYHLVTESYPVEGANIDDVRIAHEQQARHRLRDVRPDLPSAFIQVLERALDPRPESRFQTAGEFEAAFMSLGALPTPVPEPQPAPPPRPAVSRWRWAAALAIVAAFVGLTGWLAFDLISPTSKGSIVQPVEAGGAGPALRGGGATGAAAKDYSIQATFYRLDRDAEAELTNGSRIKLGDHLALSLTASRDVFVYVVNEDNAGETLLLFPLPGQSLTNPLPAGRHRLPGIVEGVDTDWQVTTASGDEHFLLFVSPTRLEQMEKTLAALPPPTRGRRVAPPRLSDEALGQLRGVGGLVPARPSSLTTKGRLSEIAEQLGRQPERTDGVWVRRLTFENPASLAR
jgi:serine/threonine protein kinase